VSRFRRADELAAYVGLTPSQYSTADKVRMGHITRAGKNGLRGNLVECCWRLIAIDKAMREKYERIKVRSGGKRAIVKGSSLLLTHVKQMQQFIQSFRMTPVFPDMRFNTSIHNSRRKYSLSPI